MSTMTRKFYTAQKANLESQLAAAKAVVETFERMVKFTDVAPIEEPLGDAWNAAHDAVTAIEFAQARLESAWTTRNVDPNTLALVAANID